MNSLRNAIDRPLVCSRLSPRCEMLGYGCLRAVVALPRIDRRDKGTVLAISEAVLGRKTSGVLMYAILGRPRSIGRVYLAQLFLMLVSEGPKDNDRWTRDADALFARDL